MFFKSSYVSLPRPREGSMDYFHVPYPSSPLDLLPPRSSIDTAGDAADPLNQLPQEVCDQIFSLLSTPALDAARYVSRTWYRRIMTNTWLLRHVLEPGSYSQLDDVCFEPHEDDSQRAEALRCLARELDVRSRLTSSGNCDEAWRVRYRRCDITFSSPDRQPCAGESGGEGVSGAQCSSWQTTFAGVSSSGSFVTFIYHRVSGRSGDSGSDYSILVYHIDSTGKPELVAPIDCSQGNGVPVNVELSEGGYAGSWVAKVTFSGQKVKHLFSSPRPGQSGIGRIISPGDNSLETAPTSLRDVQRYCDACCDYHKISVSKDLNVGMAIEAQGTADIHPQDDWVCVEKCDCNGAWLLLENLPIHDKETECPYYLARHEQTGNLLVVRLEKCVVDGDFTKGETDDGFQNLQELVPIMLLVRPHQHASYANVAVAPQIMFETSYLRQVLRIAVLWHEADYPATEKVGLYIYDVVSLRSVVCDENGDTIGITPNYSGSGGWTIGRDGNWSPRLAPLPQSVPFDYTLAEYLPIDSIDSNPPQTMKLKGRVSGRRVCGFDKGMGGLHYSLLPSRKPPNGAPLGSIRLLGDGRKKCMIWGADGSPSATGMHLTIIEFGKSWYKNEFWELSISEKELSNNGTSNSGCGGRSIDRQCACSYHDFSYLVGFPDPKSFQPPLATGNSAAKGMSLFWPFPFAMYSGSRPNSPLAPGQILASRRHGDVLMERKKNLEEHWKRNMERLERDERALTEALRTMGRNHIQGNQVAQSSAPRGPCDRWKSLFGG